MFGPIGFQGMSAQQLSASQGLQPQPQVQQAGFEEFQNPMFGMFGPRQGHGFFLIQQDGQPQSTGVSQSYIDSLPPRDQKKDAEGNTDCHICLEKMEDEKLKPTCQLPCGHAFDKACLKEWLKDHHNCPVCRHNLPADPNAAAQNDNMFQQMFFF